MTKTRRYAIFVLATLFVFYDIFIQITPGTITHELMAALHVGAAGIGFLSGVYFYTYFIMQIPAGLLFDRYPVRYVIFIPLLMTVIGALIFACMHSLFIGAIARLLIGFGSAFAFLSASKVAADLFSNKAFPVLIGIVYIFAALGGMAAQVPLAYLIQDLSWRGAVLIISAVGLVFAIIVWFVVRYKESDKVHPKPIFAESVYSSLCVVVKRPQNWIVAIVSLCTWGPMAVFASLWVVPFIMSAYGLPKPLAASLAAFMWIGLAVAGPCVGWLSNCIQSRKLPLIFASLLGLVCISLILYLPALPHWLLAVLLFLTGAACAAQPLSYTLVKENNEHHRAATAVSFNNMAAIIAAVIFQPLSGYLIAQGFHGKSLHGVPVYTILNYQHGLIIVPVLFAVSLLVAVFLVKETFNKQH